MLQRGIFRNTTQNFLEKLKVNGKESYRQHDQKNSEAHFDKFVREPFVKDTVNPGATRQFASVDSGTGAFDGLLELQAELLNHSEKQRCTSNIKLYSIGLLERSPPVITQRDSQTIDQDCAEVKAFQRT